MKEQGMEGIQRVTGVRSNDPRRIREELDWTNQHYIYMKRFTEVH